MLRDKDIVKERGMSATENEQLMTFKKFDLFNDLGEEQIVPGCATGANKHPEA
jgi:hypothetical protein